MEKVRLIVPQLGTLMRYKYPTLLTQKNLPATQLIFAQHQRHNACKNLCPPRPPKCKKKKPRKYGKYIFYGFLLATGATIGYAKYDPDFRKQVNEYIPFFDGLVAFIFCEKQSHWASIKQMLGIKTSTKCPPMDLPPPKKKVLIKEKVKPAKEKEPIVDCRIRPQTREERKKQEQLEEEKAEVVEVKVEKTEPPKEEEIVCHFIEKKAEPCVPKQMVEKPCIPEKRPPDVEARLEKFNVKDLSELILFIGCQYESAMKRSEDGKKIFKSYNDLVMKMVRCSVDIPNPNLWTALELKRKENEMDIKRLTCEICDNIKNIAALKMLFDEPCILGTASNKTVADVKRRVDKYKESFDEVHGQFLDERERAIETTKFWMRVKEMHDKTEDQFGTLLKDFEVLDKTLPGLNESPKLDMYLLEMRDRLVQIVHRIKELQMEHTCKIKDVRVDLAQKLKVSTLNAEQLTLQAQKRVDSKKEQILQKDSEMKKRYMEEILQENEKKIEFQACRYGQAMRMKLKKQRKLLKCLLEKEESQILEKQRNLYADKLELLDEKFAELDEAFNGHQRIEKEARDAQRLWLSVEALNKALHPTCTGGIPLSSQIFPLNEQICAIRKAAHDDDELINAVLASLPDEAVFRGVYTEEALKNRFNRLEKVVRGLALVPEAGAPLYMYFMSYFQGMLLLKTPTPVPKKELSKDAQDFGKLDTYDILQRARYFMDRGNYVQALRYMNLLKGAAKCIATDWIKEMKIRLETVQATQVLMAHATSVGVRYLELVSKEDD